jgi:hypothetical protein
MTGSPPKPKLDWVGTGLFALALTALITFLSVAFSAVSSLLKWHQLLVGTIVVAGSFTTVAVVAVFQIVRPLRADIGTIVERFLAAEAISTANWLITADRLKEIETTTIANHVWIITSSLEEEIEEELFGGVVSGNLKRGVKYTYFVPDDPALRARISKMKDIYKSSGLEFRVIAAPLFKLVASQDMAIFGPAGEGARQMGGYMNLPIQTGGNDYFMVLGPSQSERIVGILGGTPAEVL